MASDLTPERKEMMEQFMAICDAPEELARDFLADNRWQLEESINTYMLMISDDGGAGGGGGSGGAGGASGAGGGGEEREMASGPGDPGGSGMGGPEDEDMGTGSMDGEHDSDSLDDDIFHPVTADPPQLSTRSARSDSGGASGSPSGQPQRNFAEEGMAVPMSTAPAGNDDGLEKLFPPPTKMMFTGTFDALRKAAEEEKKYCLV